MDNALVLLTAAGISYWVGNKLSDYILIFFYHRSFLSEDRFMSLYDFSDEDYNYEFFSDKDGKKLNKYADFLRKHQEARPAAYKVYIEHLKALFRHTLIVLLITLVVPSLVFINYSILFPSAYLIVLSGWIVYKRYMKQNNISFYVMLMMNAVINHKQN